MPPARTIPMDLYPLTFEPIYLEKIWGGRNLQRLFGRELPGDQPIGESWELADLSGGVSVVDNGPLAGTSLTDVTRQMGDDLLGGAKPHDDGRFPLLLKLLDANDILSLQVHPDEKSVAEIGGDAALKTECWCIVESRNGVIYKGVRPGVTPEAFRRAIETDTCEDVIIRFDVAAGDFHYLPAGTVHALGAGVVVAEVQTPSDTTYRVTDWGRGREIHVERSMQCIHFEPPSDTVPGASGETLLVTDYFTVAHRQLAADQSRPAPAGRCSALMILQADGPVSIRYAGGEVAAGAGRTVLLPAALGAVALAAAGPCEYLEVTLPEG